MHKQFRMQKQDIKVDAFLQAAFAIENTKIFRREVWKECGFLAVTSVDNYGVPSF